MQAYQSSLTIPVLQEHITSNVIMRHVTTKVKETGKACFHSTLAGVYLEKNNNKKTPDVQYTQTHLLIIGKQARHYQGCTNSSWCGIRICTDVRVP